MTVRRTDPVTECMHATSECCTTSCHLLTLLLTDKALARFAKFLFQNYKSAELIQLAVARWTMLDSPPPMLPPHPPRPRYATLMPNSLCMSPCPTHGNQLISPSPRRPTHSTQVTPPKQHYIIQLDFHIVTVTLPPFSFCIFCGITSFLSPPPGTQVPEEHQLMELGGLVQ